MWAFSTLIILITGLKDSARLFFHWCVHFQKYMRSVWGDGQSTHQTSRGICREPETHRRPPHWERPPEASSWELSCSLVQLQAQIQPMSSQLLLSCQRKSHLWTKHQSAKVNLEWNVAKEKKKRIGCVSSNLLSHWRASFSFWFISWFQISVVMLGITCTVNPRSFVAIKEKTPCECALGLPTHFKLSFSKLEKVFSVLSDSVFTFLGQFVWEVLLIWLFPFYFMPFVSH